MASLSSKLLITSVRLGGWDGLESGFNNWLKFALGFKKQLGVIISKPEFSVRWYVNGLEINASCMDQFFY